MAWIYLALRAGVGQGSTLQTALSIISMFIHALHGCVDQGRHPPTAAEIYRRRGGSGCGGVSRMDAAT
ncbi:hypothetical protein, partial [Stenotrophomonas maltophilia]